MKIKFFSLFLFVMFSNLVFSQDEVYRATNVLERIDQLNSLNSSRRMHYDKEIKEALPLKGHTPADSLGLQYRTFRVQSNSVRLEPDKVKQVFPEVVTTTDDRDEIDYISLIPILLDAIGNQQERINQLNDRIRELENALIKQ